MLGSKYCCCVFCARTSVEKTYERKENVDLSTKNIVKYGDDSNNNKAISAQQNASQTNPHSHTNNSPCVRDWSVHDALF